MHPHRYREGSTTLKIYMNKKNTQKIDVKKKKDGMSGGKLAAIGAGVAALGAGAYYLLGPNAKEHQKKASALMVKITKEVGSEIKKAKIATKPMYLKAVDVISSNYIKQYEAHEGEIKALTKKLKNEWKSAEQLVNKPAKKAVSRLKNKVS